MNFNNNVFEENILSAHLVLRMKLRVKKKNINKNFLFEKKNTLKFYIKTCKNLLFEKIF